MTVRLLLISSSNVHGYGYLDHAEPEISDFLRGVKRVAFVPFAMADHEGYTELIADRFAKMGFEVLQVRSAQDLDDAEAIFVGGGNTFRLLKTLYELDLVGVLRDTILAGTPYIGSSAGSNIAGPTIRTTNDMPIVEPPSFDALNVFPWQINPHYLDADPSSTHMGETREQRLREYLQENSTPVVGLREGTMLRVENGRSKITGTRAAIIFRRDSEPYDLQPGSILPEL